MNSDTVTEGGLTGRLPCDPAYIEIVAVVRIPTYATKRSAFDAASDIGSGFDFRGAVGRNLLVVAMGTLSRYWRRRLKKRHVGRLRSVLRALITDTDNH